MLVVPEPTQETNALTSQAALSKPFTQIMLHTHICHPHFLDGTSGLYRVESNCRCPFQSTFIIDDRLYIPKTG